VRFIGGFSLDSTKRRAAYLSIKSGAPLGISVLHDV
jgi:hypothetical protein